MAGTSKSARAPQDGDVGGMGRWVHEHEHLVEACLLQQAAGSCAIFLSRVGGGHYRLRLCDGRQLARHRWRVATDLFEVDDFEARSMFRHWVRQRESSGWRPAGSLSRNIEPDVPVPLVRTDRRLLADLRAVAPLAGDGYSAVA